MAARLTYVDPDLPGITRKRRGRYWRYFDARGTRITDREELDRLNAIALPPAYRDAWFCPSPQGHIQAIGYDDRGRRQYRYHADFRARQDAAKYDRCADFGRALPLLRQRVEADLSGPAQSYEAVVAAVVRLLDGAHLRVGNEAYAKTNKSFGATTLRSRHADVKGSTLRLEYRAKSGIMRKLTISDRGLLRVVRKVQDLPGQNLFQYLDDDGAARPVGSADVNDYIREAMGGDFTAKHFRTWGASAIAMEALIDAQADGRSLGVKALAEPVAEALGNTPAMARKSYVHPDVMALAGQELELPPKPRATKWLSGTERLLIALLEDGYRKLAAPKPSLPKPSSRRKPGPISGANTNSGASTGMGPGFRRDDENGPGVSRLTPEAAAC